MFIMRRLKIEFIYTLLFAGTNTPLLCMHMPHENIPHAQEYCSREKAQISSIEHTIQQFMQEASQPFSPRNKHNMVQLFAHLSQQYTQDKAQQLKTIQDLIEQLEGARQLQINNQLLQADNHRLRKTNETLGEHADQLRNLNLILIQKREELAVERTQLTAENAQLRALITQQAATLEPNPELNTPHDSPYSPFTLTDSLAEQDNPFYSDFGNRI